MKLRPMRPDDVEEVAELEALSNPHPWSAQQLLEELALQHAQVDVAVDEEAGRIAGYLCTWRILDELHIQNVATHPDYRRRGVARLLLTTVARQALAQDGRVALLEVRASNAGAQALYALLGFKETGRRPRYYAPDGEDAVLMEAPLSSVVPSKR